VRTGLELPDAEPTRDGDRIFLVGVAEQTERSRLGGKFIARQKPEFGEPAKGVACRTVVCLLVLASLVGRNPEKSGHKIRGPNASVPSLKLLRIAL